MSRAIFARALRISARARIEYVHPKDVAAAMANAIDNPQETELGRSFAVQLSSNPGMSGFRLLSSGQDAFITRAALAEAAQRTLDSR